MATGTVERVQKHRAALREAGYRPLQMWVLDTRRPGFAEECRRQSRLVSQTDAADAGIAALLDDSAASIEGWS